MFIVELSQVKKELKKVPKYIAAKVQIWADQVEKLGLPVVQKAPGYKDHPLRGDRKGQRSVYLNKQWRLIYTVDSSGEIKLVTVEEVTPHAY